MQFGYNLTAVIPISRQIGRRTISRKQLVLGTRVGAASAGLVIGGSLVGKKESRVRRKIVVVSYNRERDELTGKYDMTIGAAALDLLLTLDGSGGTLSEEGWSFTLFEEEEGVKQPKMARNEGIGGMHDLYLF